MSVFVSHSSKDKPAVEALAEALRARGIDVWLDKWEIGAGDDIVAKINEGLDKAGCGIIVFSKQSWESLWVRAEASYLQYARVEEGKVLIPVVVGSDRLWLPPLLRPLARRGIDEVDAIADAVLGRRGGPPPVCQTERPSRIATRVKLSRAAAGGVHVAALIGDAPAGEVTLPALPRAISAGHADFLRSVRYGVRRDASAAERRTVEAGLDAFGRHLAALCLPGGGERQLMVLLDTAPVGTTIEVCFEADVPALLGLPFEALRLADGRLLAVQPAVVMLRCPLGLPTPEMPPPAGPLKILVAVGAPDEQPTGSPVLDQERELQTILDAVEPAQRHENVEVRILEVGHPSEIGKAIAVDAYHVLHLFCHGAPGLLELEDEDGRPVTVSAEDLIGPLRRAGRPLPLVLRNACHGGVQAGEAASLAETLLRAGIPSVLAMQTSVSDGYASRLAGAFYENLARREVLLASRALADARKQLETDRQQAIGRGAPIAETQPEYATAALFVRGDERPIADFALDKEPLRIRPVRDVGGPVPQLGMDDLIGRRRELREMLKALRDPSRAYAGVILTGLGGVGKSAVAGRAMVRLVEDGYCVPAHAGRFEIAAIARTIAVDLMTGDRAAGDLATVLLRGDLDDVTRLQLVARVLAERRLVLVLDDFERNLAPGGGRFLDPALPVWLGLLADQARAGRLLITCRYPLPGMDHLFRHIAIGPLSAAESRKLLLRLPALAGCAPAELAKLMRVIGGHPRMLEFLDGLLRGGQARLPRVTEKLRAVATAAGLDLGAAIDEMDVAIRGAILLGSRDVLLESLLGLAGEQGDAEALVQLAVSNLPMTPAGLARALAGGEAEGDVVAAEQSLRRLASLSLVHRFEDGDAWVHRWTADGLASLSDVDVHRARCRHAGQYRMWHAQNESHDIADGIEAVRNFLAGQWFDEAVAVANGCLDAMGRWQQTLSVAALAGEILETLPETHGSYAPIADAEATSHLALGLTDRALGRYGTLLRRAERLAAAEPDRADYQRDLSVSYERMGDLYGALGQGEEARQAYAKSLAPRERLAAAEPERADYQRDLSVSLSKMGDLYRALGQGEEARQAYAKSLAIFERLATAEPERADYQRDLSVSLNNMGDLYRALGQGEEARQAYAKSLAISE
ncbi:MAG: TIR domain-containing protein, partial [Allosphingosinicella sp.]